jgi:pimeloyl-ACP methyl ester carboxylesterase
VCADSDADFVANHAGEQPEWERGAMADPASLFPASVTQELITPDGRKLCFADWGGDGYPVLLMHGAPGCRLAMRFPPIALALGGRLVTYDRPGCGRSDRLPDRTVADCAPDVIQIADRLGLDEFAVVGSSAGVPPAIAVAALLGSRVSRLACYAPVAPRSELGPEEFARGQDEETRGFLSAYLAGDEEALRAATAMDEEERAAASPDDPAQAYVFEQHRQGVWGTIDDERAHMKPWGFDVSAVAQPTTIWYDPLDTVTPAQHAEWIARAIPHAVLIETDSMGHTSVGDSTKDRTAMYTWLINGGTVTR